MSVLPGPAPVGRPGRGPTPGRGRADSAPRLPAALLVGGLLLVAGCADRSTSAASTSAASTSAGSTSANSTGSTPAASTPAASTPAASTPAASTPAASTSADDTPADDTSADDTSADDTEAAAATRPAAKDTCRDVSWQPPASVHAEPVSRELIGFSPTLLGVDTHWAGDGFTAETVAGGYVDDLLEPYDDLDDAGQLVLAHGEDAQLLQGELSGVSVLVAIWSDPTLAVPCNTRAVVIRTDAPVTAAEWLQGLH